MTPLGALLVRRIAASGPMNVAEFMAECLLHPIYGAYVAHDPIGAAGHFITAPEISQMFGELIGLALAQAWIDQGSPGDIVLAELGPGRGTLMADLLRATARVPGFHDALRLHLVEPSPLLRAAQARVLPEATWHDGPETLPESPLYLVANEVLDALPVRQFVRSGDGWAERVVGLSGETLVWGLAPPTSLAALDHRLADTQEGDVVETCPALPALAGEIGRRIAVHGGAGLFIDYGDWHSLGDTLQALSRHVAVDPLATPGEADLTAHVDFETLALAASPAHATRLTPQGLFLERLGIAARTEALAKGMDGERLASHLAAHRRLTHPDEMGTLFKVMGLHPPSAPPLPGLVS